MSGEISFWDLNRNARDENGQTTSTSFVNGGTGITGIEGTALNSTSSQSRVKIQDGNRCLDFNGPTIHGEAVTIVALFKQFDRSTNNTSSNSTGAYQGLFSTAEGWADQGITLAVNDNGTVRWFVNDNGNRWGFQAGNHDATNENERTVQIHKWTHLVATFKRYGDRAVRKVYVNGTLIEEYDTNYSVAVAQGLHKPQIGYVGSTSNSYFRGVIDYVKVYNKELSKNEIIQSLPEEELYNDGRVASIEWIDTPNNTSELDVITDRGFVSVGHNSGSVNANAIVHINDVNCDDFYLFYSKTHVDKLFKVYQTGHIFASEKDLGGDCAKPNPSDPNPPVCSNLTCSEGTLSFHVSHFSSFAAAPGGGSACQVCQNRHIPELGPGINTQTIGDLFKEDYVCREYEGAIPDDHANPNLAQAPCVPCSDCYSNSSRDDDHIAPSDSFARSLPGLGDGYAKRYYNAADGRDHIRYYEHKKVIPPVTKCFVCYHSEGDACFGVPFEPRCEEWLSGKPLPREDGNPIIRHYKFPLTYDFLNAGNPLPQAPPEDCDEIEVSYQHHGTPEMAPNLVEWNWRICPEDGSLISTSPACQIFHGSMEAVARKVKELQCEYNLNPNSPNKYVTMKANRDPGVCGELEPAAGVTTLSFTGHEECVRVDEEELGYRSCAQLWAYLWGFGLGTDLRCTFDDYLRRSLAGVCFNPEEDELKIALCCPKHGAKNKGKYSRKFLKENSVCPGESKHNACLDLEGSPCNHLEPHRIHQKCVDNWGWEHYMKCFAREECESNPGSCADCEDCGEYRGNLSGG